MPSLPLSKIGGPTRPRPAALTLALGPVWTNRTRGPSLTSLMVTSPTTTVPQAYPPPHDASFQSPTNTKLYIRPSDRSSPVVQPAVPPFPVGGPTPFLAAGSTCNAASVPVRKCPHNDATGRGPFSSNGDTSLSLYASGWTRSPRPRRDATRVPVLFYVRRATMVLAGLSTFCGIVLSALCSVIVMLGGILVPGDVPIMAVGPCMIALLTFSALTALQGLTVAFGALRFSRRLTLVGLVAGCCAWGVGAWLIPVQVHDWPARLASLLATTASRWDASTAATVRKQFSCSGQTAVRGRTIDDACLALVRESLYKQLLALRAACWLLWAVLSLSLSFGCAWWLYSRPPRRFPVQDSGYRCEPMSHSHA